MRVWPKKGVGKEGEKKDGRNGRKEEGKDGSPEIAGSLIDFEEYSHLIVISHLLSSGHTPRK